MTTAVLDFDLDMHSVHMPEGVYLIRQLSDGSWEVLCPDCSEWLRGFSTRFEITRAIAQNRFASTPAA